MPRITPTAILRSATATRHPLASRAAIRPLIAPASPSRLAAPRRYQSTSQQPNEQSATENKESDSKSTESKPGGAKEAKKGLKISWIFSGLAGLGALVTIYGLLEFYSTLTTWPKEVRKPLRAALKAKLRGDYGKAETLFREALEIALQLGPSALEPEPLLKISGIYVELANVLEIQRQRVSAFVELRTALEMFGPDPLRRVEPLSLPEATALGGGPGGQWIGEGYRLTKKDHVRAIGLYQKLGQLALEVASSPTGSTYASTLGGGSTEQMLKTWDDAAEYYLSSALTSMLHLGLPGSSSTSPTGGPVILGRDVSLPDAPPSENPEDVDQGGQVDKRGLGMTMESLSEVYARKGQYDMAGQLLLQAISLLLPPQSKETPPMRDRCQAAMLMTTISSHALHPPTAKSLKVSRSWSLRSLQISQQALAEAEGGSFKDTPLEAAEAICQRALAVGLHNMGMLAEMEKDYAGAQNFFTKALAASRETGFVEGKREALAALRRVQSVTGESA
ncbi:hypothetical protein I308_101839 [Cryptococcus tetragattii IND107]|uniref:Uncharacterized protein n=1 Tax=Cryptococcus tetragattii IND107 TaxID=1296105 RepID=A0ABR3BVM9_9TREE|nr:hypothetical protein I308_02701 [Cryptococcus tetragattii IND107]